MTPNENIHPIIIINKLVTKYEGDVIGTDTQLPPKKLSAQVSV